MNEPVIVEDINAPPAPASEIAVLVSYLESTESGGFTDRKQEIMSLASKARDISSKEDVIRLGYSLVIFRGELDEWIRFAELLHDRSYADQLDVVHGERTEEALEQGSSRASAKLIETQAKKQSAPLRQAWGLLKDTRDWLDRTLFWVGQQQKMMAADEYGDIATSRSEVPEEMYISPPKAPSPSELLKTIRG
jgi:hypothetical protein